MHTHSRPALHAVLGPALSRRRGFSLRDRLSAFVGRIVISARKRRDYRILMEMDDHLLKDIGVTRDQVMNAWIRESVFRTDGR
jgi:uncharacterized protein YjiS (DUF1127 family)